MWVSLFVILHTCMSVITQYGDSALMIAASGGYTETVAELVKAKANLDLQNNVRIQLEIFCYVKVYVWKNYQRVGSMDTILLCTYIIQ